MQGDVMQGALWQRAVKQFACSLRFVGRKARVVCYLSRCCAPAMWWLWAMNGGESVCMGRRSVYMLMIASEKLDVMIHASDLNGAVGMTKEAVRHACWCIALSSVWWWSMSVCVCV